MRPDASADVPPSAGASVADLRADIKKAIGEVGGATADVLAERLFFLGWRRP